MTKEKKLIILILMFICYGCNHDKPLSSINAVNWQKRSINLLNDSLLHGATYLSIYSQIYSETEHRIHNLTATVSMRNTNRNDTVYIEKAIYYNTQGHSIRTYFDHPIFILPMETVEIVIDEKDQEGGTGANFLFDWKIPPSANEPLFQGVMISTSGQQGISFTTQGIRIE